MIAAGAVKHAQTPWAVHIDRRWINGSYLIYTAIVPAGDTTGLDHLKMADGNYHVCRMSHTYDPVAAAKHRATAELIVKAANRDHAFEELKDALKLAEAFMAGFEDDELQEGINERLATIRAAISKAEGRP